jgi:4-amino-4-deoxy-L-arabinose transferase-like glycosyltransferase
LGKGNPVWPFIFLVLTSVAALWLIYYLGKKIQDKTTGFIALIIGTFSFNIVFASRWLSNPTPMLLFSVIIVWAMVKVTEGKKWGWPIIALISGLSLFSFGSSGEFFYFPALFIFLLWQWKNGPDLKILIFSIVLFVLTFAPLVLFDIKHQHILLHNFTGTFGADGGSFKIPTLQFIKTRTWTYFDIFTNKIFQSRNNLNLITLFAVGILFLRYLPIIWGNAKLKILILLLGSAVVGLYFYQGNFAVLYDYYLTGYYLIFILLFAAVLSLTWKHNFIGKLFVTFFLFLFFINNIPVSLAKITDKCDGSLSICYAAQTKAIDWVYKDAGSNDFNVDVYVPPVISYSYDYLFKWLGTTKYHKLPNTNQVPLLYTMYEADPEHPERLKAWLARQKGIGSIIKEQSFGGITVQERKRILYTK